MSNIVLYILVGFSSLAIGVTIGFVVAKLNNVMDMLNELRSSLNSINSQVFSLVSFSTQQQQRPSGVFPRDPLPPMTDGMLTFRSKDGKYSAPSLEELVEKMMADPTTNINPTDLESLKKVFEQISGNILFDDFDDDEEDNSSWGPKA